MLACRRLKIRIKAASAKSYKPGVTKSKQWIDKLRTLLSIILIN